MGEAFSLSWDCVDFENGRLIISNREGTADLPPFKVKDHEAKAARIMQRLLESGNDAKDSDKTDAKMTPKRVSRQIERAK